MGMGNHKSLVDFWNRELQRWGASAPIYHEAAVPLNYNDYSFAKRWAMIFANDWGEGKRRFKAKFKHSPVVLHMGQGIYGGLRKIYRMKHKKD